MIERYCAMQKLRVLVCLSFCASLAIAAVGNSTTGGFSLGTTVTITLNYYNIDRADWYAEYGSNMSGEVSVSQYGDNNTNEIKIEGIRDGTLYPGETRWVMQTQTKQLSRTAKKSDISVPFGPLYTPQGLTQWTQTYKYTAKIAITGGGGDTNYKILSVGSYIAGGDGANTDVIDETI